MKEFIKRAGCRFLCILAAVLLLSNTVGCSLKNPEYSAGTEKSTVTAATSLAENSEVSHRAGALDISSVEIPDYSGKPTAKINGGVPFFSEDEITDEYYIELSELDSLGRCGSNCMCADEAHMPTGERGSISDIHPTGWHGSGIYERSHLLMWKLSGCNDKRNIITGTSTFNQETMLEYEERVTAYLWKHEGNHVMYRVTPLFKGDDLVARGVLMEAWSVEDNGQGLCYCVFCYNFELGYTIDYSDGDYN